MDLKDRAEETRAHEQADGATHKANGRSESSSSDLTNAATNGAAPLQAYAVSDDDDPSAVYARNVQPITMFGPNRGAEVHGLESDAEIPMELRHNVLVTSVDKLVSWARKSSLWPVAFGLACCAIEMMAASTSRFDISRFGAEVFRPSPRQADLMIVAGTVTTRMAPAVRRIYDQMADPKYVIAMGTCTIAGGPFQGSYSTVPGIDNFVPVDVHVPGCPPRPDALLWGIMKLQEKIETQSLMEQRRQRLEA